MTAHTPQLDSEELRKHISEELSRAYYQGLDRKGWSQHEEKEGIDAILAAFADRVLAVLPEKLEHDIQQGVPRYHSNGKDMWGNHYADIVNSRIDGFNDCRDQVTTAITNLVAEERGEKK